MNKQREIMMLECMISKHEQIILEHEYLTDTELVERYSDRYGNDVNFIRNHFVSNRKIRVEHLKSELDAIRINN